MERERDLARVADLYVRGWSQPAIAAEVGVTRRQIRYDLDAIQRMWRQSAVFDFNTALAQELAKINALEAESWAAWDRSKSVREITTTRSRRAEFEVLAARAGMPRGRMPVQSTNEANQRREQRDPNSAYLDTIRWCIEIRVKLLGLMPAQEIRHSGQVTAVHEIVYDSAPDQTGARMVTIGGGSDSAPLPMPGSNGVVRPDDEEFDEDDEDEGSEQDEIVVDG